MEDNVSLLKYKQRSGFVKPTYMSSTFLFVLLYCFSAPLRTCQPPGLDYNKRYEFPQLGVIKFAVLVKTTRGFCSGVILSDSWVLTAAHCVFQDGHQVADTGVTVNAGINDQMDISSRADQERTSSHVFVYPDFKEDMISKFDIALIKVSEPFNTSGGVVGSVKVSSDPWPLDTNFFRNCVGFGFGDLPTSVRSGGDPTKDRQIRLKMWTATAAHNNLACPCTKRFHWRRLICLRETDEIELCQGDGGGGLVCYEGPNPFKNKTRFDPTQKVQLYGIAHMTMDKYMCMITREPIPGCATIPTISVYMYLCPFTSWLAEYVPDVHVNTVSCKGSTIPQPAATVTLIVFSRLIVSCSSIV